MKYLVTGADRDSGDDVELSVEAESAQAAEAYANQRGILVAKVSEVQKASRPARRVEPVMKTPPPASYEPGQVHGAPVINIGMPRRGSSLGVASVILGAIAFLICWIPLVNLLGVPLAAVGLVLGLIGIVVALTRRGSSIGFPIAGSLLCGMALAVTIGMFGAVVGATGVVQKAALAAEEARARGTASAAPTNGAGPGQGQWSPANEVIRHGDIEIRVVSVRVGKVTMESDEIDRVKWETDDAMLRVELELVNVSQSRKIDYLSWRRTDGAGLVDNFGNDYRMRGDGTFSVAMPAGGIAVAAVYPGKAIRDVLVFQEPVAGVSFLRLELPARVFKGSGDLRIEIPASMIERPSSPPVDQTAEADPTKP